MKRKLPLGIQTFRRMREENRYYVDKTAYCWRLVEEGDRYFLSRPRRFGKSLFLDTLKELFEGNEPLFRGLYVHDKWTWSVRYPVVRLSFGTGTFRKPDLVEEAAAAQFEDIAARAGVANPSGRAPVRFRRLLEALCDQAGQRVVVLVDEYDKPILDAMKTPEIAEANRDDLRGLYATIKDADAYVRFAFLTGVSKFSKVSLFSDLNNLTDLTLDAAFSAICGYTDADLDTTFAPELPGLDREEIRRWYNGYNWLGEERMYNPFDILQLFRSRRFRPYWFETGTPTFLIETLLRRQVDIPSLDGLQSDDALLSRFDVRDMAPEALLFQTGYLTILDEERAFDGTPFYRLGYPNHEVRRSLNASLLAALTPPDAARRNPGVTLVERLRARDFAGIEGLVRGLFASIPYEWHTRNEIARYEGYYASVFYAWLAAVGLDVTVEDSSSRGRADLAVRFAGDVFLLEFKVVEQAAEGTALAQLQGRRYAEKYLPEAADVYLIGVEFSREQRNVVAFEVTSG